MKQQASLLSFFGKKNEKKKRRPNDDCNEAKLKQRQITALSGEDTETERNVTSLALPSIISKHIKCVDNAVTSNNDDDEQIVGVESASKNDKALQTATGKAVLKMTSVKDVEPQSNDTDTTQSRESDDSSDTSRSLSDSEEEIEEVQTSPNHPHDSNNQYKKSDYELLRERNIARNNARLQELGLLFSLSGGGSTSSLGATNTSSQQRRRRAAAAAGGGVVKTTTKRGSGIVVEQPTRRSNRLSGIKKIGYNDESTTISHDLMNGEGSTNDHGVALQEEEQFKVSPLFDYQMNTIFSSSTTAQHTSSSSSSLTREQPRSCSKNDKIKTLALSNKRLVPPAGLNAIYSLEFYNPNETSCSSLTSTSSASPSSSWLVGAGKSGLIALWDCNNSRKCAQAKEEGGGEDEIIYLEPAMSWKGHNGRWVSDARFLPQVVSDPSSLSSGGDGNNNHGHHVPNRLLTAGNDGTICNWDLSATSLTSGTPRLIFQSNKSLHSSGIFSMDVKVLQQDGLQTFECLIATGSKDKSIAVSKLSLLAGADHSKKATSWRSQFHTGKVASVSFSSSSINPLIASASDDGLVAIHDMRMNDVVVSLENTHVRPHSAVWKPSSDSIFVTAGLDDVIKLWDLRNTAEPVMSFQGHVPISGMNKKLKRIHRPTFFNVSSESFILSGGENSHSISMFRVDEENVVEDALRSVFSRGKLPDGSGDVGSMAVHSSSDVAVTTEGGEVIVLTPRT